jgi:hypothetical protein
MQSTMRMNVLKLLASAGLSLSVQPSTNQLPRVTISTSVASVGAFFLFSTIVSDCPYWARLPVMILRLRVIK